MVVCMCMCGGRFDPNPACNGMRAELTVFTSQPLSSVLCDGGWECSAISVAVWTSPEPWCNDVGRLMGGLWGE